jgi:hypothetical protein
MTNVRQLLKEGERFPCRRTFERRLKALPETLPEQIGCLGRHLVALLRLGFPRQDGSSLLLVQRVRT